MCSFILSSLSWERRIQIYLPLPVTSTVEQSPQHCFICNKTVLWASTSRDRETSVECNQIHTSHHSRGWRLRREFTSSIRQRTKAKGFIKALYWSTATKYSQHNLCVFYECFSIKLESSIVMLLTTQRDTQQLKTKIWLAVMAEIEVMQSWRCQMFSQTQLYFHPQPPGG